MCGTSQDIRDLEDPVQTRDPEERFGHFMLGRQIPSNHGRKADTSSSELAALSTLATASV